MNRLRTALHQAADLIADAIEERSRDWVDQAESPLGRQRHIALVKTGKLPGYRDGRRVLVKRADIDRYIESKRVLVVQEEDEERAVARALAQIERRRVS